jgi:5'-nucleotidase
MRILVTNDDGIDSPGLHALEAVAAELGEVWTVAPATEQSARSHALTMHEPLRVHTHGPRRFAVTGTPADCSYLAIHHLLPDAPSLVLSGINRGANLGDDVVYSGTVAAAREAASFGVPALAVSLWVRSDTPHWETAQAAVRQVAPRLLHHGLPSRILLNLNVPDLPAGEVRGVRVAPLALRHYAASVEEKLDPRGRRYYWIGGEHDHFAGAPDADGPLCEDGWSVITPLQMDLTAHDLLGVVRTWGLEDACSTR